MIRAFFSDPAYVTVKWYQWGAAIGLAITLVVTLWIFYDSQRYGLRATLWRGLSLLSALVVVPSAMLSLAPSLAVGLSSLPILLAYLGVLASLLSLAVLVLYAAGIGVSVTATLDEEPAEEAPMMLDATAASAPPPGRLPPAPGAAASADAEVVASQSVDLSAPFDDRTRVLQVAPQKPQPLAWLVVMNGHRAGSEFRLDPLADIGRDGRYNSIAIEDPTMSRQHARVRLEKDEFVVYDLASANGVSVNGEKQQRWPLRNGDRVVIGQTEFGFITVAEDSDEQA
jgi:hypothetical protein